MAEKFTDPDGNTVACHPSIGRSGRAQFVVVVSKDGVKVDRFMLDGQEALDQTAKRRGWVKR